MTPVLLRRTGARVVGAAGTMASALVDDPTVRDDLGLETMRRASQCNWDVPAAALADPYGRTPSTRSPR